MSAIEDVELKAAAARRERFFLAYGEEDWLAGSPMDPCAVPADPVPAMAGYPFLPAGVGAAALLISPTGAGKSTLAQVCAYDGARAGIRTLYLGHEVTEDEFNARAAKIAQARGDTLDQELRDVLALVRYVDLTETIVRAYAVPEAWAAEVADRYDVVLIDPVSAVETALGLDFTASNPDYLRFHDPVIRSLVTKGVSVVLLDNIGNALEARDRAKGASAKQDRADLTFPCRLGSGSVALIVKAAKVRSARASHRRGDEWAFYRDSLLIERRNGSDDSPATDFRPSGQMERVSRHLEDNGPLGKKAVRAAVPGRNEYIDKALAILEAEGYIEPTEGGFRSVNPFRETDGCPEGAPAQVPPVPTVPIACPEGAPDPTGRGCPGAFLKGHRAPPDQTVNPTRGQRDKLAQLQHSLDTLNAEGVIGSPAVLERRGELQAEITALGGER